MLYLHHKKVRHWWFQNNLIKSQPSLKYFEIIVTQQLMFLILLIIGEMNDIFVGLMGRRNSESSECASAWLLQLFRSAFRSQVFSCVQYIFKELSSLTDNGPWRKEYPEKRGIFLNKCRLRWVTPLFLSMLLYFLLHTKPLTLHI